MIPAQGSNSKILWTVAIAICATAFAFMLYAALHEAAIVDEAAHIPAGYAYVHELDFRLNPEHPPLVKALAALPLLFIQPKFPTDNIAWTTDVNSQWAMGEQFLYKSGNNADTIVAVSRLMPILLTLLTILFIYFWSKKLVGGAWALLPTFLFAFSPTVLAHGHYVTTDLGAAFGVLLATYFFVQSLREPSPKNILLAGLALGVAELLKFSAVLLFPYFIILAIVHFFVSAQDLYGKYFWQTALRKLGQLAAIFLMAFLLAIYPVYGLFTAHYPQARQVADTQSILSSFNGKKLEVVSNAVVWMAGNALTRPLAEYFLGAMMVLQRSTGGNTGYFLGQVSADGSHAYFPIVYLLKESLPALIIVLGALLAALWGMGRTVVRRQAKSGFGAYLRNNFTGFALIIFLFIYWGYSVRSTLNIGVRHLMPVIPIMYILATGVWKKWIVKSKFFVLCALLLWVLLETFLTAPYFLSYFNQIGGGTWGGYRYVTDSNYDWGQDLLRLRGFVNAHPEIDKIAVDNFGTSGSPHYYLGEKEVDWWSAKGNPADQGIHWFAISTYNLQNSIHPTAPDFFRRSEDNYSWLTSLRTPSPGMGQVPKPDYRIGTTIFVYKL